MLFFIKCDMKVNVLRRLQKYRYIEFGYFRTQTKVLCLLTIFGFVDDVKSYLKDWLIIAHNQLIFHKMNVDKSR